MLKILTSAHVRIPVGLALILVIGFADIKLNTAIPLSILYFLPIAMMSPLLNRWQVVLLGLSCMFVAEWSDDFVWNIAQGIPRDALYLVAYTAAGLYMHGFFKTRKIERGHRETLQVVEEQLRLLVSNSSLAILITDETGNVLQANAAAEKMFRGDNEGLSGGLQGSALSNFLPALSTAHLWAGSGEQMKTMMQCQGMRNNAEPFLADVWFSTYMTTNGGRLTAMMMDTSLEIKDREEASLEQTLAVSKLAVSALSHEIRNIAAAASGVVYQMTSTPESANATKNVDALRQLIAALQRLSSQEVISSASRLRTLRIENFLRDLYVILQATLRDAGVILEWHVEDNLPIVWADRHSLLQVFLNVTRNAITAVAGREKPLYSVTVFRTSSGVAVRLSDNGPGIKDVEYLFRPFHSGSGPSGLGLYLSRAMMRSMQGDLRLESGHPGATFLIELMSAGDK